jgi:hypothetical protein
LPGYECETELVEDRRFRVFRPREKDAPEYMFEIDIVGKADCPRLGRRGFEMLLGMITFAKERGELVGQFRLREMAGFLKAKPPESGRFYADIQQTSRSLAALKVRFPARCGQTQREYRFIATWHHDPGTRQYKYSLNRDALGITALWLEDLLTADDMGNGYINYPLTYVKDRLTETEKAFRDYLLTLRYSVETRAWTIAKKWCGFSEDFLKRRKEVHDRIYQFLGDAKTRGDIASWASGGLRLDSWKTDWKIEITKPQEKRRPRGKRRRSLTPDEEQLVQEIFKWQRDPVHGLKLTEEELVEWLRNTVRTYGTEDVRNLYVDHGAGAKPSVHLFWVGIKELKAARADETSTGGGEYAPD